MGAVASATWKEWAAYRSHMMVSIFIGPAYFLIQYFIWQGVFSQGGTLGGFSLDTMLLYYGVNTLLNYCIMDFAGWNLQNHIQRGTFITFMLLPVSHRYYALSQKVGHRLLGVLVEFIPVFLILRLAFGLRLVPQNILYAAVSFAFAFLINFYINYSIGAVGFWLVKNQGVRSVFNLVKNIFAGVFIPLTLFPEFLQKALFFLPFQYISYVPVSVFIGEYHLADMTVPIPVVLLCQAAMVLAMAMVSRWTYNLGIRKYVGVGL